MRDDKNEPQAVPPLRRQLAVSREEIKTAERTFEEHATPEELTKLAKAVQLRAELLYQDGKFHASIRDYRRCAAYFERLGKVGVEAFPFRILASAAHRRIAEVQWQLNNHEAAVQSYAASAKVLQGDNHTVDLSHATERLAVALFEIGRLDEAHAAYEQAVSELTEFHRLQSKQGASWLRMNTQGEFPFDQFRLHGLFARLFEEKGHFEFAYEASKRQYEAVYAGPSRIPWFSYQGQKPPDVMVLAQAAERFGRFSARKGDLPGAIQAYEKALEFGWLPMPDAAEARITLDALKARLAQSALESNNLLEPGRVAGQESNAPVGREAAVKSPLPKSPAKLFVARSPGKKSSEQQAAADLEVVNFIKEVYGPYYEEHRTKLLAYIRVHDPALTNAIAVMKRNKRLPAEVYLPSQREALEELVQKAAKDGLKNLPKPERGTVRRAIWRHRKPGPE